MARERMVRVFEVLADTPYEGPAADGTVIFRFHGKAAAEKFAAANTCYGHAARANEDSVPARIAARWSFED